LIPATDNRPGKNAYAPGDVIKMYDGTTVEVLNTDAEGRMILADAIAYADKFKPEVIIDAATLTGAAVRAIGDKAAIVMGNAPKKYIKNLKKSGKKVHERLVEFPFWDEWKEEMKSDIADMKNIGSGNAGMITAGKFLEHFAIEQAKESNRYETENQTAPSKPFVTESMEADLLDSFDTIKILQSTLGFPVYDKVGKEQVTSKELLFLNGRNVRAEGDLIDDGFVVFKGSRVKKDTTPSCHEYLINLRNKLIQNEILIDKGDSYEFSQDYVFNSPSTAGGVILGRSTNGWTKWKNKEGKTLDELKRK